MKTDVAKFETAPASVVAADLAAMYTADAGLGMQDMSREDFAIPFLKILQQLSPEVNKQKPEFITGAEQGDFVNTVTKALFKGGDVGVRLVRVHFEKKYLEWRPVDDGGGLVRISSSSEEAEREREPKAMVMNKVTKQPEMVWPTEVIETAQISCLMETPDGWQPVVLPWSKSKLKVSRAWAALASGQTTTKYGIPGNTVTLPIMAVVYRLGSRFEQGKKGDYFVPTIEAAGLAPAEVYAAAKEFRGLLASGEVKLNYKSLDEHEEVIPAGGDPEVPGVDDIA